MKNESLSPEVRDPPELQVILPYLLALPTLRSYDLRSQGNRITLVCLSNIMVVAITLKFSCTLNLFFFFKLSDLRKAMSRKDWESDCIEIN